MTTTLMCVLLGVACSSTPATKAGAGGTTTAGGTTRVNRLWDEHRPRG